MLLPNRLLLYSLMMKEKISVWVSNFKVAILLLFFHGNCPLFIPFFNCYNLSHMKFLVFPIRNRKFLEQNIYFSFPPWTCITLALKFPASGWSNMLSMQRKLKMEIWCFGSGILHVTWSNYVLNLKGFLTLFRDSITVMVYFVLSKKISSLKFIPSCLASNSRQLESCFLSNNEKYWSSRH